MLDKAFFFWPQCITQEFGALFQRNEVNGVLTVFTTQSDRKLIHKPFVNEKIQCVISHVCPTCNAIARNRLPPKQFDVVLKLLFY